VPFNPAAKAATVNNNTENKPVFGGPSHRALPEAKSLRRDDATRPGRHTSCRRIHDVITCPQIGRPVPLMNHQSDGRAPIRTEASTREWMTQKGMTLRGPYRILCALRVVNMHTSIHSGGTGITGIPHAMFTAYTRSPRGPPLVDPVPARRVASCELDARFGARTTRLHRPHRKRSCTLRCVHRIPPRERDDRVSPSVGTDRRSIICFYSSVKKKFW